MAARRRRGPKTATIGDVARAPRCRRRPCRGSSTAPRAVAADKEAPRARGRGRARLRAVRPRTRPAPAAGSRSGRSSSPTSRTRSSRRSSAASRTSPTRRAIAWCCATPTRTSPKRPATSTSPSASAWQESSSRLHRPPSRTSTGLIDEGIPVVAIDRLLKDHDVDSVIVDNRSGARDATQPPARGRVAARRVHRRADADQHVERASRGLPRGARRRPASGSTARSCAAPTSARTAATRRRARCSSSPAARRVVRRQQPDDARRAAGDPGRGRAHPGRHRRRRLRRLRRLPT